MLPFVLREGKPLPYRLVQIAIMPVGERSPLPFVLRATKGRPYGLVWVIIILVGDDVAKRRERNE